jgi:hypothetical protein
LTAALNTPAARPPANQGDIVLSLDSIGTTSADLSQILKAKLKTPQRLPLDNPP